MFTSTTCVPQFVWHGAQNDLLSPDVRGEICLRSRSSQGVCPVSSHHNANTWRTEVQADERTNEYIREATGSTLDQISLWSRNATLACFFYSRLYSVLLNTFSLWHVTIQRNRINLPISGCSTLWTHIPVEDFIASADVINFNTTSALLLPLCPVLPQPPTPCHSAWRRNILSLK